MSCGAYFRLCDTAKGVLFKDRKIANFFAKWGVPQHANGRRNVLLLRHSLLLPYDASKGPIGWQLLCHTSILNWPILLCSLDARRIDAEQSNNALPLLCTPPSLTAHSVAQRSQEPAVCFLIIITREATRSLGPQGIHVGV